MCVFMILYPQLRKANTGWKQASFTESRYSQEMDEVHVAVRLNLEERLTTLTRASSINLVANRDADFTPLQIDSLRRFNSFLRNNYTELFPTIARPILSVFLVLLRSTVANSSATSEARICLSGLRSQYEVTRFHQVLTQSHCRVHCDPLKLCYSTSLIRLVGADRPHTTFEIRGGSVGSTLVSKTTVDDNTQTATATIGGFIEVEGRSYAVTIVHDEKEYHQGSNTIPNTFVATENKSDAELPLVVDSWANKDPPAGNDDTLLWCPSKERFVRFGEWALIPVPWPDKRPNSYVLPQSDSRAELRTKYWGFRVLGGQGVEQYPYRFGDSDISRLCLHCPLSDFMQQARQHIWHDAMISIPLPFATFLDLGQHDLYRRESFIKQAISTKSLEASVKDAVARQLFSSVEHGKANEVERLVKKMKLDHGALKKLFEDLLKLDSSRTLGYKDDVLGLAQSIVGDGMNLDIESQNASRSVGSSILHEVTSTPEPRLSKDSEEDMTKNQPSSTASLPALMTLGNSELGVESRNSDTHQSSQSFNQYTMGAQESASGSLVYRSRPSSSRRASPRNNIDLDEDFTLQARRGRRSNEYEMGKRLCSKIEF
ncbi:hypothetical protein PG997_011379 [Apiospora hydei]|uniref:Uncharacterized protein n=1 Tax=Apiospora hydei TaxID=1337664 RepID=A0ABR1VIW5_9PEZI